MSSATVGLRLLLVDDEEQILELLTLTLSMQGYQIITAMSGPEALEKVKTSAIDVIIMDILMSPWDGFETFRRLYDHYGAQLPAVVFLSGLNRPEIWPLDSVKKQEYLVCFF